MHANSRAAKKTPKHPYPVNETLQEPLGCVNPGSHLLLVLRKDSKERHFTRLVTGSSSSS